MYERTIKCEVKEVVNGIEIQRCEAMKEDPFTGELSGHKKVYYDTVYDDCIMESFKTIKEARAYAKNFQF